jgi:acetolactate decarboxylase
VSLKDFFENVLSQYYPHRQDCLRQKLAHRWRTGPFFLAPKYALVNGGRQALSKVAGIDKCSLQSLGFEAFPPFQTGLAGSMPVMLIEWISPCFETLKGGKLRGAPMRTVRCLLFVMFLTFGTYGCANLQANRDTLFQASTIDALLVGGYDGEMAFRQLKRHGDFGLGTFNNLDGEMIAVDGIFYQVKFDGIAYPVQDAMKTPFSVVTFFEPDEYFMIDTEMNYEQIKTYIDGRIPTEDIFYALRIKGVFKYIKTRSVPAQEKPYRHLVDVVKDQAVFEFHDVEGIIVGFRTPGFVQGINIPGYHLHFITEDRKAGGHVLECQMQHVGVELDFTSELHVVLPEGAAFTTVDLSE